MTKTNSRRVVITASISGELVHKLNELAREKSIPFSRLVDQALHQFLEKVRLDSTSERYVCENPKRA